MSYDDSMLSLLGVALGVLVLILGATALVRGASDIALGYGVSPMVVGLTLVSFGTSAPELVVSLVGATQGSTEIAFGNVVGSNISNLGLVLGAAAAVKPIAIQGGLVRRELPLLLLATTMVTVLAMDVTLEGLPAAIGRSDAIILLLIFGIFVYITVLDLLRLKRRDPLLEDIESNPIVDTTPRRTARWLLVIAGVFLLFIGGELTIRNGIELAQSWNVSATIVGLFVVAVGTSMPELVTSLVAAVRGESDLALGNVIGSNLFNSLFVLPACGLVGVIPVPDGGVTDVVLSWVFTAALVPCFFLGRARLGRGAGVLFLVSYFGYAAFRVIGT